MPVILKQTSCQSIKSSVTATAVAVPSIQRFHFRHDAKMFALRWCFHWKLVTGLVKVPPRRAFMCTLIRRSIIILKLYWIPIQITFSIVQCCIHSRTYGLSSRSAHCSLCILLLFFRGQKHFTALCCYSVHPSTDFTSFFLLPSPTSQAPCRSVTEIK